MPTLLDVLFNKLTTDGVVGGASGFAGFVAYSPDTQDQIVSVYDSGGLPEETQQKLYSVATVQVRVRSKELDYLTGRQQWDLVYASLQNADLSAQGVLSILAMNSAPLYFIDSKNRPNFTVNFRVRSNL